jgi:hypothetical protein
VRVLGVPAACAQLAFVVIEGAEKATDWFTMRSWVSTTASASKTELIESRCPGRITSGSAHPTKNVVPANSAVINRNVIPCPPFLWLIYCPT